MSNVFLKMWYSPTIYRTMFKQKNICRSLSYFRIKDIYASEDCVGCEAEIKGWVKGVRKMKEHMFVDIDDGSGVAMLQVVVPKVKVPEGLSFGSSVKVSGQLVANQQKKVELVPSDISVVGPCVVSDGFPFLPKKSYDAEYIRKYLHFRPRMRAFSSLLRVRHCAIKAINDFFNDSDFVKIDVPVLTSNDCEGAGEVFNVRPDNEQLMQEMASQGTPLTEAFFNSKTYLTVSGQMHLEAAARALGKVYCVGPTFRAENSKSRLHLSEFYMVEAELAFTESLDDVLNLIEGLIKNISKKLMDTCPEELIYFAKTQSSENSLNVEHLLQSPFTVDSYDSVCDILDKHSKEFSHPIRRGEALSKEHELFLVKFNNDVPIFVIDWPVGIKPFYMKARSDNPTKVHAVDLLCSNVGELCGGSLREDNFNILENKLRQNNLSERLDWYLELRKFGNVPTGGFGMGFERYLQVILGIPNIKDVIPFPRWPHNCKL